MKQIRATTPLEELVSVEMQGFTGVITSTKKNGEKIEDLNFSVTRKVEEVKSAILASNIALKKIEGHVSRPKPPFPEIPKTDLSGVEKALALVLAELKKPEEIVIKLELE